MDGATRGNDVVSGLAPQSRVKFIRVRANIEARWIPAMADTTSTKRFRVYFEERSRTEVIVHAASADEAKKHSEKLFRKSKRGTTGPFKVRSVASNWTVDDLSE
jgi:hypothetical protein